MNYDYKITMSMTISIMKYTLQYMRKKEFRKLECVYRMQNNQNKYHTFIIYHYTTYTYCMAL